MIFCNTMLPDTLDKPAVIRNFNRAAPTYDQYSALQKQVLEVLLEQLPVFRIAPQRILDLGCGTGRAAAGLRRHYPSSTLIQLDIARAMLQQARRSRRRWLRRDWQLCADADALPLADASMGLVFSSLMLQWSDSLAGLLTDLRRVLRPDGLLLFATLGPGTLQELDTSWQSVEAQNHIHAFPDIQALGELLMRSGYTQPVLATDRLILNYPDLRSVLKDLRCIGAVNSLKSRRRSLTGKGRYQAFARAYETQRADGMLPATYEVIYGHAWRATETQAADHSQPLRFIEPTTRKPDPA
ncbi:MAG: malonyl-ACP O-methyltransferase BioC [Thiotrichales bacterium]|nr:malonyl-ACP O-methyltransferase BioC [Thiotrichales bacterium]